MKRGRHHSIPVQGRCHCPGVLGGVPGGTHTRMFRHSLRPWCFGRKELQVLHLRQTDCCS